MNVTVEGSAVPTVLVPALASTDSKAFDVVIPDMKLHARQSATGDILAQRLSTGLTRTRT